MSPAEGDSALSVPGEENSDVLDAPSQPGAAARRAPVPWPDVDALRARCGPSTGGADFYAPLRSVGLEYGPAFRGIEEVWVEEGHALARVRAPASVQAAGQGFHPALLDACLHVCLAALKIGEAGRGIVFGGLERMTLHKPIPARVWCIARLRPGARPGELPPADVRILDEDRGLVAEIAGLSARLVDGGAAATSARSPFYEIRWNLAEPARPATSSSAAAGRWLLLVDRLGTGAQLSKLLAQRGGTCREIAIDELPPAALEERILEELRAPAKESWRGIVHAWALEVPHELGPAVEQIVPWHERLVQSTLSILRAWRRSELIAAPRLWLLTRGAQAVRRTLDVEALAQAPLLGLGRTITYEHPELSCTRVDLDPGDEPVAAAQALVHELLSGEGEDEIALRGAERFVARLSRVSADAGQQLTKAGARPFRLEQQGGAREPWAFAEIEAPAPGPGQVVVAVEHGALARDTSWPSSSADRRGTTPRVVVASGVITAAGDGVDPARVGQSVVAFSPHGPATHAVLPARLVLPRPPTSSSAQAAAVLDLVAAQHGLAAAGRLLARERVLIEGASSPLGRAALQVARRIGAEVLCLVRSDEDGAELASLGATVVAPGSLREQHARVDVVALCEAGADADLALGALGAEGRAVALGPAARAVEGRFGELSLLLAGAPLIAVDVQVLHERRQGDFLRAARAVLDGLAAGALSAPLPLEVKAGALREALEADARASSPRRSRVVSFADPDALVVPRRRAAQVRPDGTYLVAGGLGGFGLAVAAWLVEQGARHLVLVGRTGAVREDQKESVARLTARGAEVVVASADLSRREDAERVFREMAGMPPLRGVIQSAGVLRDMLLVDLDEQALLDVMRPKVHASLLLHELTARIDLDFFVLFASASGLLGTPAQGNYAAANTFLDALALHRHGAGRPGISIDWGLLSDVGLGAEVERRGGRMTARGFELISPARATELLGEILSSRHVHVGAMGFQVHHWADFNPQIAGSSYLRDLLADEAARAARPTGELRAQLKDAPAYRRGELLQALLREQVCSVLRLQPEQVGPTTPFTNLGLDSLMALELRNRLETQLGRRLSATLLWKYPHLEALAGFLMTELFGDAVAPAKPAEEPPARSEAWKAASHLEDLSDGEAEALLDEALMSIGEKLR